MKRPLAFRMQPQHLDDITGQQRLIGESKVLHRCALEKRLFSMIFYEPPGTGKTMLAMMLTNELELPFRMFNTVTGNKRDLETIFQEAEFHRGLTVTIDEMHWLSKDKQNLLLPCVESSNIILTGTTTSNPLHTINPTIRFRCHLFEIEQAQQEDVGQTLMKTIHHQDDLNDNVQIEEETLHIIVYHSSEDIRHSLNALEICALAGDGVTIQKLVPQYSQFPNMSMDSDGDGCYDVLSGFQRSIRGSDVGATLYYLGIMIEANDMDSIERGLLVTACEDIGLGNPVAVAWCATTIDATKRVGFPEARIILAVAVIGLILSPKSKNTERVIDAAVSVLHHISCSVPDYLRFTPINMDDDEKYDYKRSDLWNRIQYLPDRLRNKHFYESELTFSYEEILAQNLGKLRKVLHTSNLKALKKQDSRQWQ